jgi:hypothetical protein
LCNWSGNESIDEFIKKKQQETTHPSEIFQWIPYDQFENLVMPGKGDSSIICLAEWKDGYLRSYHEETHEFSRQNVKVALKYLGNCNDNSDDLLCKVREIKILLSSVRIYT